MSKAKHVHRQGAVKRNGRSRPFGGRATPARDYPPGYFTELIRKHNFPPMFEPCARRMEVRFGGVAPVTEEDFARARGGWGAGTMDMPRTPSHAAPGWIR